MQRKVLLVSLLAFCIASSGGSPRWPTTVVRETWEREPQHVAIPVVSRCGSVGKSGLSLDFHRVGLRRLDSDFANSSHVNSLSLEDNEIVEVSPSAFRQLPNLQRLSLARNNLSLGNFSRLLDSHAHLHSLDLDANHDPESNGSFLIEFDNEFPCLRHLHLRADRIKDVKSLKFAPGLTHLYLSSNDLAGSKLDFLNDVANTLEHLELANSSLKGLSLEGLSALRELDLSGNRIGRVCGRPYCRTAESGGLALAGASNLQRLILARNEIASLEPDAFDRASQLGHLDLSHNLIDAIRKETFDSVGQLRNLSLEGNLLSDMPDLDELRRLEFLSLADNRLASLDNSSFVQLTRLRFIDLSGNRIERVEANAFGNQTNLEVLKLSSNRLTSMPHMWLLPLGSLKLLYLENNRFEQLDDLKLAGLRYFTSKLERVLLQNNSITSFRFNSFKSTLKSLPNVTLEFFDDDAGKGERGASVNDDACKCSCKKREESLDFNFL